MRGYGILLIRIIQKTMSYNRLSSLKKFLPTKRFVATLVGAFLAIIVIFFTIAFIRQQHNTSVMPSTQERTRMVGQNALTNFQNIQKRDSDEDGIPDWEEALWGTNPQLADTDNDGFTDSQEIGDIKEKIEASDDSMPSDQELSDVDVLSRDLYSTIALLDQQGVLDESHDELSELFQGQVMNAFNYDLVTLSDINLGNDSPEVIDAYRNDLIDILRTYTINENDWVFIAGNATKPIKQPEALEAVEKYQNYFEAMKDTIVPIKGQQYHLNMLNAVKGLWRAGEAILYTDQDPLLGASATLQLSSIMDYYSKVYQELVE